MKPYTIAHLALAALLSAGLTVHAQPAGSHAADSTKSSASKASEPAHAKNNKKDKGKKARKPSDSASNPGTSGGAGNRSGGEAKDGASFSAPRPAGVASKPTGTGWD